MDVIEGTGFNALGFGVVYCARRVESICVARNEGVRL